MLIKNKTNYRMSYRIVELVNKRVHWDKIIKEKSYRIHVSSDPFEESFGHVYTNQEFPAAPKWYRRKKSCALT